jgi:hypothetical protein
MRFVKMSCSYIKAVVKIVMVLNIFSNMMFRNQSIMQEES